MLRALAGGGRRYVVRAFYDDEAKVWVAESKDVPGLATEAESIESLVKKLRVMVPELIALNRPRLRKPVPYDLVFNDVAAAYA